MHYLLPVEGATFLFFLLTNAGSMQGRKTRTFKLKLKKKKKV